MVGLQYGRVGDDDGVRACCAVEVAVGLPVVLGFSDDGTFEVCCEEVVGEWMCAVPDVVEAQDDDEGFQVGV